MRQKPISFPIQKEREGAAKIALGEVRVDLQRRVFPALEAEVREHYEDEDGYLPDPEPGDDLVSDPYLVTITVPALWDGRNLLVAPGEVEVKVRAAATRKAKPAKTETAKHLPDSPTEAAQRRESGPVASGLTSQDRTSKAGGTART